MIVALVICAIAMLGISLIAVFGSKGAESDREPLERFLHRRDSSLLRMEPVWGPGYPAGQHKFGRRGGYVYSISYLDSEDRCHFAECETNAAIGVILRRDGVRESGESD